VLTESEVAFIPREEIKKLAFERPNIGMAMWFDTLVDASVLREWIANVGRRDARTRVAHLLCEFSLRLKVSGLGEATDYQLPMTQEQIADATGLTAVHVNRTAKGLEADGLIVRKSSRSIEIGDWKKLAAAGDFDSNYLHLKDDEPALAWRSAFHRSGRSPSALNALRTLCGLMASPKASIRAGASASHQLPRQI
jgi:hypothetical protein